MNYTVTKQNKYLASRKYGDSLIVCAASVKEVADQYESITDPLIEVRCEESDLNVLTAQGTVAFTTAPKTADTGKTYPAAFTVDSGDKVILSAVPATGYAFDHWERNGTSISVDAVTQVTVTPAVSGESSVVYTAVFTVSA